MDFDENKYRADLTKEIAEVYNLLSMFLENPVPTQDMSKKIVDYLNKRSKSLNYRLYKLNGGNQNA